MAKVQFSPIITAARKKLGNVVFTVNRFGPVMRKRVKGVNPKSSNQNTVRSAFSASTKAYSTLSTSDQAAWGSAAAGIPKTDVSARATPTLATSCKLKSTRSGRWWVLVRQRLPRRRAGWLRSFPRRPRA